MTTTKATDLARQLLEHRDGLFGFVLALTRDREAAEEIFQEVGLAMVEEGMRGTQVARFLPWAHEMIRRRTAEFYRKNSRRRTVEHSEPLDEAVALAFQEQGADPAVLRLRKDHLEECLESLAPAQREMIEKRYRDRLPLSKVADAVDWTVDSVKVGLWKARRQLERCIEGRMASTRGGD